MTIHEMITDRLEVTRESLLSAIYAAEKEVESNPSLELAPIAVDKIIPMVADWIMNQGMEEDSHGVYFDLRDARKFLDPLDLVDQWHRDMDPRNTR